MKRPSFQFYPSDWLRDTALRTCSTGARGLWMDMICFMHEGNPYGYLKVGNKVILSKDLARMVGEDLRLVEEWLEELHEAGVYDIDDGAICSRRMIRDENLRKIRAEGGKLGGNPKLKDNNKDNLDVKQKQTPSSTSSSSSTSTKDITPVGVSDSIFQDYLKIRKAKKSPWTPTAQKLMENEAKKAGISLQEAMEVCCARGWVGFKAEWHKPEEKKVGQLPLGTDQQIAHAYKVECGGDPTKARFNSYYEMRKFIEDFRDKQKRAIQT